MTTQAHVRVLVVDDDQEDARLVEALLEESSRAQFAVEKVFSAEAGLDALAKSRFDVIILDYKLPDMDGLAFLAQIYDVLHYKVPVIIVTSHGDRNLQSRALDAGAAEYLEKGTFTQDVLVRTCIYAIGLAEKQSRNGSGLGVGVNIETLVELTRESVRAQSQVAGELRELRGDFAAHTGSIKEDMGRMREDILYEVRGIKRFRWLLDWIRANPVAAITIILSLTAVVVAAVLLLNVLDTDKLRALWNVTTAWLGVAPV